MKELIVKTSLVGALVIGGACFAYDEHKDQIKVEQLQKKHTWEINKLENQLEKLNSEVEKYIKLNNDLTLENKQIKNKNVKLNRDLKTSVQTIKNLKAKVDSARRVTISRGSSEVKRTVYVTATAYTSFCREGCTGKTATGVNVQNSTTYKGARIIAVDPSVIPLGSLVKVYPKDRPPFYAYAKDTGGAIDGNKIDYLISVNNESEANKFGRQHNVKIEIIQEGSGSSN